MRRAPLLCRRALSTTDVLVVGRRALSTKPALPSWATVDPWEMSAAAPAFGKNLCGGVWTEAKTQHSVVDPLNGEAFIRVPDTQLDEIAPFVKRMKDCPRTGLHNPLKNPERYNMLGEVMARGAQELGRPEVADFFAKLIQRLVPKSWAQCTGEPTTTRKWMENYSTDQVRYLARSFGIPGDHAGQTSTGVRMPFGGVSVITPFNFPLEIPALQSLASVYMGNKCTVKVDERVQIVYEQFLRMCLACGLPPRALDLIYCAGPVCNELLVNGDAKMTLFTGSQHVAEKLTLDLRGRVKLEDAGFDWKILGPDVADEAYVTWQADQDAYPRPRGNRVAGGRHPSASRPSCPRAPRRRRDVSRRVPAASPRLVSPPSSPRPRPRLVADSPRPPAAPPPRRVSTDVPGRGADLPPGTGTRSRARSARRSPSASCTRTGSGRASSTR